MKILFITSTRLGDAIISTTVLNYCLKTYPHARLMIACGELPSPLFEDLPNLDKLYVVKKKRFALHWAQIWQQTLPHYWDMAIDLRGSALTYFLSADRRIIWRSVPSHQTRHEQLLNLFETQENCLPKIWVSPQRIARLQGLLPTNQPIIALAPAANWHGKEWPQDRFLDLIKQVTSPTGLFPGARIAIFAAPHEFKQLAPLFQGLGEQVIPLPDNPHLLDVAALLQQCTVFIGNDSGLMHLSAAMGTPTLGLFGPSDDRLYRPSGARAAFVRTPEAFDELWARVKGGQSLGLMDSLTVEMVLNKLAPMVEV